MKCFALYIWTSDSKRQGDTVAIVRFFNDIGVDYKIGCEGQMYKSETMTLKDAHALVDIAKEHGFSRAYADVG